MAKARLGKTGRAFFCFLHRWTGKRSGFDKLFLRLQQEGFKAKTSRFCLTNCLRKP